MYGEREMASTEKEIPPRVNAKQDGEGLLGGWSLRSPFLSFVLSSCPFFFLSCFLSFVVVVALVVLNTYAYAFQKYTEERKRLCLVGVTLFGCFVDDFWLFV